MVPYAASVVAYEEIRTVWSKRLNDVPCNYRNTFLRTAIVNTISPMVRTAFIPIKNLSVSVFTLSDADVSLIEFPLL